MKRKFYFGLFFALGIGMYARIVAPNPSEAIEVSMEMSAINILAPELLYDMQQARNIEKGSGMGLANLLNGIYLRKSPPQYRANAFL